MSIEQAILELAAAIRYAADKTAGGALHFGHGPAIRGAASGNAINSGGGGSIDYRDEVEKSVTKVETDAKAEQKKVMEQVAADRKPSTAKEAVADALARAKAEKEAAAKPVAEEDAGQVSDDPLADSAPLDYEKDVKPLLIKVGKDKTALVALLDKFGAKKGDQIAATDYAAVVAAANAIIGG